MITIVWWKRRRAGGRGVEQVLGNGSQKAKKKDQPLQEDNDNNIYPNIKY